MGYTPVRRGLTNLAAELNVPSFGHCVSFFRVKNSQTLHRTFNVDPLYLQHENSGQSRVGRVTARVSHVWEGSELGSVPWCEGQNSGQSHEGRVRTRISHVVRGSEPEVELESAAYPFG